jgi:hypothetical protein
LFHHLDTRCVLNTLYLTAVIVGALSGRAVTSTVLAAVVVTQGVMRRQSHRHPQASPTAWLRDRRRANN